MGNTYLTRNKLSNAEIVLIKVPSGESREKTLAAKSASSDKRTVSIQPLANCDLGLAGDEVASLKPKSLQIKGGKVTEKK